MRRDPRERFTTAATFYAEHRPRYPEELLDWLVAKACLAPGGRIADVGCGTGIATRQLAGRGYEVIGVEPNEAMLALARDAGGATFCCGEASATGLPDASVDLVMAAQAFHHFDLEPTLSEWRRIARRDASWAVFWYRLTPGPFKRDFHALRRRYAIATDPEPKAGGRVKKSRIAASLRGHPSLCDVIDTRLRLDQWLGRAELRGRLLASSQIASVRDEGAFEDDVTALFDRHAEAGRICVRHDLFAVCGRFAPDPAP